MINDYEQNGTKPQPRQLWLKSKFRVGLFEFDDAQLEEFWLNFAMRLNR